jgi:2-haloacid dehalogenase
METAMPDLSKPGLSPELANVRALVFDVFGTVVDWRSGVAREAEAMLGPKGHELDWLAFADAWRSLYQPAMEEVRSGRREFVVMDVLHREMLDGALAQFGVSGLDETELRRLSLAWRRLDPWPDAVEGLQRLKAGFAVAALSNGNVALILAMAKRAGLPWDAILGAELVGTYKPAPAIYDSAPRLLDLSPAQVMMVACHPWDLKAAAERGLRTGYVHRPLEWGAEKARPMPAAGAYDVVVGSFTELADALDA